MQVKKTRSLLSSLQIGSKGIYIATHWINHYLVGSVACFVDSYPLLAIHPVDSVIQTSNNWALINWR